MALGKARSNKRSSSSSRSATLTTIILVALCIFGLWLLAPDTLVYPRTTSRTSATTSSQSTSISDSHEIHPTIPIPKKSQPVFQDSQGDLPEDAIQPDHETMHNDHKDESSELPNQSLTENEAEVETDNVSEQDSGPENNGQSESSSDNNNEAEGDGGGGGGNNKENSDVKEKDLDVGENAQKFHGTESVEEQEKQQQLQTQNSEESSITQNQEVQETKEEHASASTDKDFEGKESQHTKYNQATSEDNQEKSSSDEKLENHQSSENNEHEISDEDQQKRLQQHQQQEDDQVQHGKSPGTQRTSSHDQVEHDEATLAQTGNRIDQSQLRGWKYPETHQSQHNTLHNNNPVENISNEETGKKAKPSDPYTSDFFPSGESSEIPKESKKNSWSTQAHESCLDNEKAIAKLRSRMHYEHRERHCPEDAPTCLVPLTQSWQKSKGIKTG